MSSRAPFRAARLMRPVEPGGVPVPSLAETLSAAIDKAEQHAQRARELGWPAIADAFERCRAELIGLVPADAERVP